MSKNEQMHSFTRPSTGPGSLVQGAYGTRGNLELVVADASDGLWVHWLNADPEAVGDVAPGAWSGGLHFAAGTRYTAAQILQDTLGPDFLEVLALTADGVLESWFWSPGPGFQRRDEDAASGVADFHAVLAADGTLTVALGAGAGVASSPAAHPARTWVPVAAELPDRTPAERELAAAGVADVAPGSARAATSTRDGGARELTWRGTDGVLRHLAVPLR